MLKIGDKIPSFTTIDQNEKVVRSTDFTGYWTVLYFYPKDNTPGCTQEACDFRDANQLLKELGCKVFGVSKDSPKSHMNFIEKHNLSFDLLSDTSGELCEKFGVWVEKSMYGKKYFGIERSTFIFHNGKLVKEYRKVKAAGHAEQVLEDLKALQA